jgi:hypothetical protein
MRKKINFIGLHWLATAISTLKFLGRFFFMAFFARDFFFKKNKKQEQDFMHSRVIEYTDGVQMAWRQPPGTVHS